MLRLNKLLLLATLALGAAQTGQTLARAMPPTVSQAAYSADGLYNQANSYVRAGKLGWAVLSYERAALLAPGDPDINANLAYARNAAHVSMAPPSWCARLVQGIRPDVAAGLGVAGIVLLGIALVVMRRTPRMRWLGRAALALGVVPLCLMACSALLLWPRLHEGVVLVDRTAAHAAPASMADTVFVLREAQSVRVLGEYGNFVLVRTPAGASGWVTRTDVAAVVPTTPH